MRLLVLGGTRFLGRHLVEAALARGDDVTIFTRGRLPLPWGDRVTALAGDRDPQLAPGLDALAGGAWDAVVDCSGYVPRIVEASARLLAARTNRYVFVSSMSVYAKTEQPGMDERTAVATLDDPATEQVMEHYGALKAACEAVVERIFAERATNVRPGLIVGPLDGTDRFGYWVARFVHPSLLGDRAAECRRAGATRAPGSVHRCARSREVAARDLHARRPRRVQRLQSCISLYDGRSRRRGRGRVTRSTRARVDRRRHAGRRGRHALDGPAAVAAAERTRQWRLHDDGLLARATGGA
jgi:nucleoside-diphosphate-sugar epimerase